MSEDEGEKGMDKDTVEIKIRFNKFWLERAIYIVIILILVVLVFYNPFGKYRCEKGLSEIRSEPVAEEGNKTTEPVIKEKPEEEVVVEEEPETEPETESEQKLSGKITLSIEDIELDVNKTKVQSITVKVDNQKKIFTPSLFIYWYDDETLAVAKKPRTAINYTGAIPPGTVKVWKLDDELKARYLSPDDLTKEIFKVELYDAKDPVAPIDTKIKSVDTD